MKEAQSNDSGTLFPSGACPKDTKEVALPLLVSDEGVRSRQQKADPHHLRTRSPGLLDCDTGLGSWLVNGQHTLGQIGPGDFVASIFSKILHRLLENVCHIHFEGDQQSQNCIEGWISQLTLYQTYHRLGQSRALGQFLHRNSLAPALLAQDLNDVRADPFIIRWFWHPSSLFNLRLTS